MNHPTAQLGRPTEPLHLASILLTQPWLTRSRREISQGRTPRPASSTMLCLTTAGKGRPLMKTPPSWFTPLCPGRPRSEGKFGFIATNFHLRIKLGTYCALRWTAPVRSPRPWQLLIPVLSSDFLKHFLLLSVGFFFRFKEAWFSNHLREFGWTRDSALSLSLSLYI